ncbi:hypothetical protein BHE74_00047446 [Ensete ventricosum]|nr:hypothetical protein BHE74_00047446 [Ensete ventricosum]
MTMNLKKGADDYARAKFDNPIRSDYHAPARSSSILTRCQGDRCVVNCGEGLTLVDFGGGDVATTRAISRSERQREKRYDHGVGKVLLLVGADATVVVQKKDSLMQKNASVEELRKPTGSNRRRESRCTRSPTEEKKANALEVSSFDVDERLPFDSKKR